jgi:hypothetical protein
MKAVQLLCATVFLASGSALHAQVLQQPNSGFENWGIYDSEDQNKTEWPIGWGFPGACATMGGTTGCASSATKTSIANSGSYAIEFKTTLSGDGKRINYGSLSNLVDLNGLPSSARPIAISFYAQFYSTESNKLDANVTIYSTATNAMEASFKGMTNESKSIIPGSSLSKSSYKKVTIPIEYISAEASQYIMSNIGFANDPTVAGDYFRIDDIVLEYKNGSTPVEMLAPRQLPLLAAIEGGELVLAGQADALSIVSMQGAVAASARNTSRIAVGGLAPGIYILHANVGGKVYSQKFKK